MKPKVSVIMPSYNVAPFIRRCMDSVIGQTLKDIEIICVDAGSSDGTLEILREYEQQDPRIRVLVSDKKSYGYQMNMGLQAAGGEYVGIVETDDYIALHMYAVLYDAACKAALPDIVKSGYHSVYQQEAATETKERRILKNAPDAPFRLSAHYELLNVHPSIWSCIYKRDFLLRRQIRFLEVPGAGWVDNPFFLQTLCEADSIYCIDDCLYYYYELRPGASSEIKDCSIPISRINDMKDYLEKSGKSIPAINRALYRRAVHYIGLICQSAYLNEQNIADAKKMLARFPEAEVSDLTETARSRYPAFFPQKKTAAPSAPRKWSLRWLLHKVKRGILCCYDHGFAYTAKRGLSKIRQALKKTPAKNPLPDTSAESRLYLPDGKQSARILFIASDNNRTSGAFISMTVLNKLLRESHGLETLVVLPKKGNGSELLDQYHIPYVLIPSEDWVLPLSADRGRKVMADIARKKKINDSAISRLIDLIKAEQIDIVHVNTTYSYVGAVAAMLSCVPLVWHLREFLEEDQHNTLWDRDIGNRIINKADKIVAISDSLYQKYVDTFDRDRLVRIYNGVDADLFCNPSKTILQEAKVVLIMIGGFEYYKGQIEFARACVLLHSKGFSDFEVHFVGTGSAEVKNIVASIVEEGGISDKIRYLGYRRDVYTCLRESDISFTCSASEAFGRTTAEAMLSGNLVIGADTAGTKELLQNGENGLLYKQGDPESLCDAILKAVRNRDLARTKAKAGQQYILRNMTAALNAQHINDLYRDILDGKAH